MAVNHLQSASQLVILQSTWLVILQTNWSVILSWSLKITQRVPNPMQSFINIHTECKRALPEQMMTYKHSILLHKLYNTQLPETEWIALNFQQLLTSRQTTFSVIRNNDRKIGNNILTNHFHILNNKVLLSDLNDSISTFKVKHKKLLL